MSMKLKLGIVNVLVCCAFCHAQDTTIDYAHIFADCMKNKDMSAASDTFVATCNDAEAVAFLQGRIGDPNSSKLAMIGLAKLARTSQTATDILYDTIYARNGSGIEVLGYLEPDACGTLAEPLLTQAGALEVRKPAAEVLGAAGNAATVERLKAVRSTTGEKSRLRKAIDSAIAKLQYKLANVPLTEQQKWAQEDLLLWRTLRETPDISRSSSEVYGKAAMAVKEQGKQISRSLLEYKVVSGDIMGIALVGAQREAWAVDELRRYAQLGSILGDFSRAALMRIGTAEATAALHESLVPNGSNRANVQIIMMLELKGGRESAELFKALAQHEEYSERHRKYMVVAAKTIERRLARQ